MNNGLATQIKYIDIICKICCFDIDQRNWSQWFTETPVNSKTEHEWGLAREKSHGESKDFINIDEVVIIKRTLKYKR